MARAPKAVLDAPRLPCTLCGGDVYGGPDTHPCCAYWAARGYAPAKCPSCVASREAAARGWKHGSLKVHDEG